MNLKQYKIDTGQIGGLITVFSGSLVILSPFSFLGILALNYDRYIKYWIDLNTFILLSVIGLIIYEFIYFIIIYPSIVQFGNKQSCAHENPIYNDIQELKKTLNRLEKQLEREKKSG